MPPVCVYASEVAALIGRNRYKSQEETMISVMNRNRLVHPQGKELQEHQQRVAAVVQHVQMREKAPPPSETIDKVATQHKVDAAVLQEAVNAPEAHPLSAPVQAAVKAVKDAVKKNALQEAVVENNVPEQTATQALLSKEACDHGIRKEEGTERLYVQRHCGTAHHSQQAVKKTFTTQRGNEYVLFGRLDGYDPKDACVVEYKNRMHRLFARVPDYELPQLYVYMALTSSTRAKQVEQWGDDTLVHEVHFDDKEWESILENVSNAVDEMIRIDGSYPSSSLGCFG